MKNFSFLTGVIFDVTGQKLSGFNKIKHPERQIERIITNDFSHITKAFRVFIMRVEEHNMSVAIFFKNSL